MAEKAQNQLQGPSPTMEPFGKIITGKPDETVIRAALSGKFFSTTVSGTMLEEATYALDEDRTEFKSNVHVDMIPPAEQKEFTMAADTQFATLLEAVNRIGSQHQADIHGLESRIDIRITDLKDSFAEFRRDTREDVLAIRSSVDAVEKSNKSVSRSIYIAGIGLIIATVWAVYYGSWTILGTLTSVVEATIKSAIR